MTEKIYLQTFVFVWLFIGLGSLATFLVSRAFHELEAGRMTLNFFLGGIVSVMLMSHNYKTTVKTVQTNPEALRKRAMGNFFFRYVFYAMVLLVVLLNAPDRSWVYLVPAFVGFTAFKVTMVANFLIQKGILTKKGVDIDDV